MEKKELEKLIFEKSKKAERERRKREYTVIAIFAVVFFIAFCYFEGKPENIGDAVSLLIVSFVLAAIHCAINHLVFGYLSERDEAANKELKELRKQLSELSAKEFDEYIKKYKKE